MPYCLWTSLPENSPLATTSTRPEVGGGEGGGAGGGAGGGGGGGVEGEKNTDFSKLVIFLQKKKETHETLLPN